MVIILAYMAILKKKKKKKKPCNVVPNGHSLLVSQICERRLGLKTFDVCDLVLKMSTFYIS